MVVESGDVRYSRVGLKSLFFKTRTWTRTHWTLTHDLKEAALYQQCFCTLTSCLARVPSFYLTGACSDCAQPAAHVPSRRNNSDTESDLLDLDPRFGSAAAQLPSTISGISTGKFCLISNTFTLLVHAQIVNTTNVFLLVELTGLGFGLNRLLDFIATDRQACPSGWVRSLSCDRQENNRRRHTMSVRPRLDHSVDRTTHALSLVRDR